MNPCKSNGLLNEVLDEMLQENLNLMEFRTEFYVIVCNKWIYSKQRLGRMLWETYQRHFHHGRMKLKTLLTF